MPTLIEGSKYYTVLELAKVLDITPQTVRAYLKKGKLKGTRVGRPILINELEVKKLLEA